MNTMSEELMNRYLNGTLSQAEERELLAWVKESEDNLKVFKQFLADHQFSQSLGDETSQAWAKLKVKLASQPERKSSRVLQLPRWVRVAAIAVIALFAGFFVNQFLQPDMSALALNEIVVPNGEKAQVRLSDGTVVYLNAGTTFSYPAAFSQKQREVILVGEAFFEVSKDRSKPFIIETPDFDVRVTGTSFNLKTYPEDHENSLTLHSGSVEITQAGKNYQLNPGDQYTLNTETQQASVGKGNLAKSRLWNEGGIYLENLDLEEIARVLERKFDVELIIAKEELKVIRYNGQFKAHESLEEVLHVIQKTSPVKFDYELNETKDQITIH